MTRSRFSAVAIALVLSVVAGCANGAETSDSPSPTPDTEPAPVTTVTTVTSTVVPDSTSEVDGVDGVGDDVLPLPPLPEVVTDETTPPPAPQPIPDWVPVSLTAVEGTAPFPAPPLPPGPVDLVDVAVEIDDLVSNAPGCASQCITSAVLRAEAIGAGATIAVTTNVSTKLTLWVSTTRHRRGRRWQPCLRRLPCAGRDERRVHQVVERRDRRSPA